VPRRQVAPGAIGGRRRGHLWEDAIALPCGFYRRHLSGDIGQRHAVTVSRRLCTQRPLENEGKKKPRHWTGAGVPKRAPVTIGSETNCRAAAGSRKLTICAWFMTRMVGQLSGKKESPRSGTFRFAWNTQRKRNYSARNGGSKAQQDPHNRGYGKKSRLRKTRPFCFL
jgi:hypothetical protein